MTLTPAQQTALTAFRKFLTRLNELVFLIVAGMGTIASFV